MRGAVARRKEARVAHFEVLTQEGMNFVKATIENETIQAERGALCWMTGEIEMDVKLPFIGRALKAYLSEESLFRPTYTGTGEIYLESSFGGFHVIELSGASWIFESGAYWASEGSLHLSVGREKMWTSFWAGEGFIDWQTKLSGHGKMVLCSPGPIERLTLAPGQQVVANGKYVLGRTADVIYRIQRPTRTLMGAYMAGEGYCRSFEGPGQVILCSVPYWRYRMFTQQPAQPQQIAAVE
jgi:uncharacterized protein (AIM24 family)